MDLFGRQLAPLGDDALEARVDCRHHLTEAGFFFGPPAGGFEQVGARIGGDGVALDAEQRPRAFEVGYHREHPDRAGDGAAVDHDLAPGAADVVTAAGRHAVEQHHHWFDRRQTAQREVHAVRRVRAAAARVDAHHHRDHRAVADQAIEQCRGVVAANRIAGRRHVAVQDGAFELHHRDHARMLGAAFALHQFSPEGHQSGIGAEVWRLALLLEVADRSRLLHQPGAGLGGRIDQAGSHGDVRGLRRLGAHGLERRCVDLAARTQFAQHAVQSVNQLLMLLDRGGAWPALGQGLGCGFGRAAGDGVELDPEAIERVGVVVAVRRKSVDHQPARFDHHHLVAGRGHHQRLVFQVVDQAGHLAPGAAAAQHRGQLFRRDQSG